jgi:hypothetical protein
MQLGKTIVGALIGAALGIGLLVVVFLIFHLDRVWLAVPVALLTGLGVRLLVSTSGHPSYARGALTGLFALMAYLFGWWVVAQVATAQSKDKPGARAERPAAAVAQADDAAEADDAEAGDAAEAAPAAPVAASRPAAASGGTSRPSMPRGWSPFDFIWLCVAGLIAYELGRGTGAAAPATTVEDESMPSGAATAGSHPDA